MSLYKYYPPKSSEFILTENGISLRYSQPIILNDPYELIPTFKSLIINKRLEINSQNLTNLEKETLLENYKNDLFSSYSDKNLGHGFISLSKKKSSNPMWAYYSKDHTGFVINFKCINQNKKTKTYLIDNLSFKDVNYDSKRLDNHYIHPAKYYLHKDKSWEHEEEVRNISILDLDRSTKLDQNGFPIHTKIISPIHIESIILGVRSDLILERKIKFWVEKYAKNVEIKKARLCESTFNLIYENLYNRHTTDTPST